MKLDRVSRVEFISLREYFINKLSNYTQTKQKEFKFYEQEQTNLSTLPRKKSTNIFLYQRQKKI